MKPIWWGIWILGALLLISTVDTRPDPPAVNSGAQWKVAPLQDCPDATTVRLCDGVGTSHVFLVHFVAADALEPHRPTDRMVVTGQAADPSPPLPPAQRKPSFQS
jgi:hypothetical protein